MSRVGSVWRRCGVRMRSVGVVSIGAAVALMAAFGTPAAGRVDDGATADAAVGVRTAPDNVVNVVANPEPLPAYESGRYIVQVEGAPVVSYDGSVDGFAATAPAAGEKLDLSGDPVHAYRSRLAGIRAGVVASVAGIRRIYDYDIAFNGFAADLSGEQAAELAKTPGVTNLWKNEVLHLDTASTPEFLGLAGRHGLWRKEYGGPEHAGEGVIVGVVDSGVWPESKSFAALAEPRVDQDVIEEKWHGDEAPGGSCWAGEDADAEARVTCNNKVIGARFFDAGRDPEATEFHSPRDWGGHGTHVGSTIAGNPDVPATVHDTSVGEVSGMAPAARLASYKVCWEQTDDSGGCHSADAVAAIDQAVADGVDVINYSISGSQLYVVDPVELAFLNAADAGVFVAASAGNSGPDGTVAHNSPWLTTVASSTHDRGYTKTLTLGNGQTYDGMGVGAAVESAPLVLSTAVAADGVDDQAARYCAPGSLTGAEGAIVVCSRGGGIALVDKSAAVRDAGGSAIVLLNEGAGELLPLYHVIPTMHLNADVVDDLEAYAATDGATAELSAGVEVRTVAPRVSDFSSAGPALAGEGDLLKPDITAPGSDVIAAVAPPGNDGTEFAAYSGTSMSSPHIAGIAALLKGKNPDWSPMWIKSALMTTASGLDRTGTPIQRAGKDATPFDIGAGHVDPAAALDPGLVFDAGRDDWSAYACAIGQAQLVETFGDCADWPEQDPSELNGPSIAVGALAGAQTVRRTVTNVSSTRTATYTAGVDAPEGFDVSVSPSRLAIPPGGEATFEVTITRSGAALDQPAFGSLALEDRRGGSVSIPIAVLPVALSAPAEVAADGTDGATDVAVRVGFDGTLDVRSAGLVPADVTDLSLRADGSQFDPDDPTTSVRTGAVSFAVAEGGLGRVATFDEDYAAGTDIDMFVYKNGPDGPELVDYSAQPAASELVSIEEPGEYTAYVTLFAAPEQGGAQVVRPNTWSVSGAEGNLTVTPASSTVTTGAELTLDVAWSGLAAGVRHLGVLTYLDGETARGRTIVTIDS